MKSPYFLSLFLLFTFFSTPVQAENRPLYFAEHPTLTPDGKTVYFSLDGAIWKVETEGGTAKRITGMQGSESHPKVSPDGKWLAFSSSQYGNKDVFLLPLEGGSAKQLTFHQANDEVSSWSWDSEWIYFTSDRKNRVSTYRVHIDGGTPERVFGHYFNTIHDLFPHPESGELFFNYSWESQQFDTRKGYRGPYNPDIQSYNPETKEYKQYTDWEGKDFATTIDRNGTIYFVSDEGNGQHNLYTFKDGKKTALTDFDEMVNNPSVNADGGSVVFEKDYQLWIYDTASGETRPIPVNGYRHSSLEQKQNFSLKSSISDFDISSDEKKMAMVAKGRLFVSDIKGKFIKELNTNPAERVLEVYWLPKDEKLIYSRTYKGFTNWFSISADGKGSEKQLTGDKRNNRLLFMGPKKEKAVYLRGREEVMLMDLKTLKSEVIAKDELWGFQNDRPSISPDGKFALFTARRNFETDVMLVNLKNKKVHNLTQTGISESNPGFSPDGKYLYFISDRTEQSYPYGMQNPHVYRVPLTRHEHAFRSEKFDSLFVKESKKKSKKKKTDELPEVNIDFDGFMSRIQHIGPRFGQQRNVYATQKGDKEIIFFTSNHDGGSYGIYKLEKAPFEKDNTNKIKAPNTGGLSLTEVNDNLYFLIRGSIHKMGINADKTAEIKMDHFSFYKNLDQEFKQMFDEVWANLEENYYNEDFNGIDWKDVRDRYAEYLPFIQSRADLRRLLNDMMGELNTSHYGFTSSGSEENTYYKVHTAETGLLFSTSEPYKVKEIIPNGPADFSKKDIRPGDELIAVNGEAVDPAKNRESYFAFPQRPAEIALTFNRNNKEHQVKIHPESHVQIKQYLYNQWIANNAKKVGEDGKKRIGYVHMKDMSGGSLEKFMQDMVSDSINRDGLIVDLRYNTGGNVHDKVLQFLSQRPYLQWQYRGGKRSPQPNFAPADKPIVMLINEQTLSDGEMTAAGFKELGLGTILGTGTYRWIIFTSSKSLVDGSHYRLPSWGTYTLDGDDLEKVGVEPDIFLANTFTNRLNGEDPQLEEAIRLILEDLEKK